MPKNVVRKFEAFAMHAHHDTPATYNALFQALSELRKEDRVFQFSDDVVVGFPIVTHERGYYFIQVVEGGDHSALVLNIATGSTRENILGKTEVLSHATHLVVSPTKRRAAIEFVQRGAKAVVISAAIEGVLRNHSKPLADMRFEFAPIISKTFISEINSFARIREASLRVTRPNASWSDRYTELSDFMEESDGDKVEVSVKAKRSQSLSKTKGIVGVIKEVVADAQPYLDDAAVTGRRGEEPTDTTIHAGKHIVHTRATVVADDAGVARLDDIKSKLARFLGIL